MIHPIPTWLKNSIIVVVLFALFGMLQQSATAETRSMQNLGGALADLDVPPRNGSPFVVPDSGLVLVNGRKVRCPYTASHFVWMGKTGNGDRLVITKDGGSDYAVFVGSAEPNSNGVRMFGVNGIREHDPGLKFFIRSDAGINWKLHALNPSQL